MQYKKIEGPVYQENLRKTISERRQGVGLFLSIGSQRSSASHCPFTVVRKKNEINYKTFSVKKKKYQIVHYSRLKTIRERSKVIINLWFYPHELQKDFQINVTKRIFCQLAVMKMVHCCSVIGRSTVELESLYTTCGTTITLLGTCKFFFAEPPLTITPVPEINSDEEPTANEIKPEQKAAVDAIEEQLVTVADEQNNFNDDE